MRRYLAVILLLVIATAAVVYDGVFRYENSRVLAISNHLLERVYSRTMREYYALLADARTSIERDGGTHMLLTLQQSSPLSNFLEAGPSLDQLRQPGDWQVSVSLEELSSSVAVPVDTHDKAGLLLDLYSRYSNQRLALRIDMQNWIHQTTEDLGLGLLPFTVTWRGNALPQLDDGDMQSMTLFNDFLIPEFSLYLSHNEILELFNQYTLAILVAAMVSIPEAILLLWLWRQYFRGRNLQKVLERTSQDLQRQKQQNQARSRMLKKASEQVKGLNDDLEKARIRMELSERLAALGEISAGIAHEINNPVAYSLSNLSTLKEDLSVLTEFIQQVDKATDLLDKDSEAYQALLKAYQSLDVPDALGSAPERIHDASEGIERVARIIQDMRKLSRGANDGMRACDLNRELESVFNIARSRLKGNIQLITELQALPPVHCNPSQIGQVVLNMLVNSIQAIGSDKGGEITLRQVVHDQQLEMSICDNGPGMDEETASKVFEPFFTTKDEGQGTGMGLALCYQLIEAHQGRIELATEKGKGTCFTVWLPLGTSDVSAGGSHAE